MYKAIDSITHAKMHSYRRCTKFPSTNTPLFELRKGQLVRQTQSQLGMLKHMIKAQVLDGIIRRVDVVVRVLEVRLDHEGRRIASFGSGCVVGTGVSALCEDVWNIAILQQLSAPAIVILRK